MSDIERKILSKMIDPQAISEVWESGLREEAFEEPINRYVFGWMTKYWHDAHMRSAPTRLVMETKFPAVELETSVDETTSWLIGELQDRIAYGHVQRLALEAVEAGDDNPQKALKNLFSGAYAASEQVAPRYTRSDMALNVAERRERYARRSAEVVGGLTLGLAELDAHTQGILPGELAAIAAYTKMGKSFFLVNAAVVAHKAGYNPLVMTLEQDMIEFEDRIDALYSGVSYERMQKAKLSIEESKKLREYQDYIADMGEGRMRVERPDRGDRTISFMVNRARQVGSDYLIIDQLSFIDAEREYRGDRAITQKHGDLVFELKDEIGRASAGKVGCLLAVQLNRDSMKASQGGRGNLHNFAHSSMIEQTVDLALGLWRNDEMRANNVMGLDIMGSRRCDLKSWLVGWQLSNKSEILVREEMN